MRVTKQHLENMIDNINTQLKHLNKQGRYGLEYVYGHTNVVYYDDPSSSAGGTRDVRCGLTKGEAEDVLWGMLHALDTICFRA